MSNGPGVHLNLAVRGLPPSATLAINERCAAMRAAGRDVFKLGLGQSPFPVPEPVVEALRRHAHEKDYLAVRGLADLRDAIAAHHVRSQQMACTGDDVLVGPGSKELMFLVQLVFYGDLCIPTPSWVSYAPQAAIIGRRVVWIPTRQEDDWRMTPEDLEAACAEDAGRPRLLILNYPSNPTGATYGAERLRVLAEAARAHKLVVLSDEIYGDVHHRGAHVSIARFYPEGTIVSSGLSKWCGAGGWRLGYFVFPRALRWLLDAMAAVASETFTSTSAPIQYAAVRAFEDGPDIDAYLDGSRAVLGAIARYATRRLRDAGATLPNPEGGFYLFPDFGAHAAGLAARGVTTSAALCEAVLAETGVAFLPGSHFGRPPEELTARLAYVDFDGGRALAAAAEREGALDDAFVTAHCDRTKVGVDRLCDWLGAL